MLSGSAKSYDGGRGQGSTPCNIVSVYDSLIQGGVFKELSIVCVDNVPCERGCGTSEGRSDV